MLVIIRGIYGKISRLQPTDLLVRSTTLERMVFGKKGFVSTSSNPAALYWICVGEGDGEDR